MGFCPGPCGRSRGGGKRSGTTPTIIEGGTGLGEGPCRIDYRGVFFGLKVTSGSDKMAAV